jgi:DNA-binding NtrC family response regulator
MVLKDEYFLVEFLIKKANLHKKALIMKPTKIIIAEDDEWYAEFLEYHIRLICENCQIIKVFTGKSLLEKLNQKPAIITLDYSLPDFSGIDLLKKIHEESPETQVIIISGQSDVAVAVNLLKEGVFDYIVKDVDTKERIWNTIRNIQSQQDLLKEVEILREEVQQKYKFDESIIGQSSAIKRLYPLLEKAAANSINVSITGETGTGKELIAKAIHFNSSEKKGTFVAVNLGAIPRELAESELFGHEKGSFTGAINQRIGKFEEAENGTLFLDEIGELDASTQVKLLRVLQEREITRVGGNKTVKVNCRIICATHKDLQKEVEEGRFRQDLFYRIIGLPIELPSLRKREGDIVILAKFFLEQIAKENKSPIKKISAKAKEKLLAYHFPGNVRELKTIIELAAVLSEGDIIEANDLTFHSTSGIQFLNESTMTIHEITLFLIHSKLERYKNDIQRVADELGIGKSTIYRLLKEEKEDKELKFNNNINS